MTKTSILFKERVRVIDPLVLMRKSFSKVDFSFYFKEEKGVFYLVKPTNGKEVRYLQLLDKNISLFVPYEGEGLLVRARDIESL
tara:strand:+ start:1677 stop:1928 length:252 start_codon:yes stop_codon:yes gene_type:complete